MAVRGEEVTKASRGKRTAAVEVAEAVEELQGQEPCSSIAEVRASRGFQCKKVQSGGGKGNRGGAGAVQLTEKTCRILTVFNHVNVFCLDVSVLSSQGS